MNQLARDVQAEPDFDKAAAMAVARVGMIFGVDYCSLYVLDSKTDLLHLVANDGISQHTARDITLPVGSGIIGLVAKRAEPVNVEDATRHPAFEQIESIDESSFKCFLGAPIVHNRRSIGVLTIRREYEKFTDDEEGLLLSLATKLSPVVAHAVALGTPVTPSSSVDPQAIAREFSGIPGSPGISVGRVVLVEPPADINRIPDRKAADVADELHNFEVALAAVRDDMQSINATLKPNLDSIEQEILDVYVHILDDEAMGGEVRDEIEKHGQWAQGAIKRVFQRHIDHMEETNNEYFVERSTDLRDIAQQLVAKLQDYGARQSNVFPSDTILAAEEITASMIAKVPDAKLKGIVSQTGSANSHTAILARALGIPAVMGAADFPLFETQHMTVIIDGTYGEIVTNPTPSILRHYRDLKAQGETFARELAELRDQPAETRDGHRVRLWVNIGLIDEISQSLDRGAEGIGLFRTEIPFADSAQFPTEAQQLEIYRKHMIAFDPKPVTMRTLDIGGDKVLPYFSVKEDNPFLGWRGIRVTLDHPEIFLVQIRAMVKASEGLNSPLRIMLPMISNLEEIQFAKNLINQAYRELRDEGFSVRVPDVGVMIEVPALIYQARLVSREVDFLAVGSNDLTQYMLAVSRNNARVANLYQELHPSVLWALRSVCVPVCVCVCDSVCVCVCVCVR
ncbi:MAG: phosphoenolpyruvate--protein phosphotransferase, partial [Gammaproteobacteria bacterium]|nr:phosphoenolpyruvate--protein phosphotransferase [Gammaproteobacteria bacterium]